MDPVKPMASGMRAARDVRVREGLDTDYELYRVINKKPGASVYELAKELGWSSGKVYGSVRRLEKDSWIRTEKAERDGRSVLKVKPVEWFEFLTPAEIEEFKNTDF
ncbi:MAG: winged helix-turn-helix transcriptional regulator [Methanothrix sp.]|nr:winged helix-turn-helix transcriptional regulator [Methanothrix sp.]